MTLTVVLVSVALVAGGGLALLLVALGIEQYVREYARVGAPPWITELHWRPVMAWGALISLLGWYGWQSQQYVRVFRSN